jgi:hypothetical protein
MDATVAAGEGQSSFRELLRSDLDERRMSVRSLARLIDPDNPERARRNLMRYLSQGKKKTVPSRLTRFAIADALGIDPARYLDEPQEVSPDSGAPFRGEAGGGRVGGSALAGSPDGADGPRPELRPADVTEDAAA